jgi:ribosome-associated heat shock protein Hsp15
MVQTVGAMRIDRWLWAARFFKSRSLAAAACSGGKVDVNHEAAKPARLVRPGDLVAVTVGPGRRRIARVVGLTERRGPAGEARLLYEDLTPPEPPRPPMAPGPYREPGAGRPTKRERRRLDRLRGG